jgi:hypothetical protein
MAARKVLINDDTINKFSFMLPGKGNSEVDEVKGMYHVYNSPSCCVTEIYKSSNSMAMLGGSPCHQGMACPRVADGRDGL